MLEFWTLTSYSHKMKEIANKAFLEWMEKENISYYSYGSSQEAFVAGYLKALEEQEPKCQFCGPDGCGNSWCDFTKEVK